ncbi:hypothetical protein AVEN_106356-1 [Araneus ventricosus]|uniref:Reverse transcriptase domain-containing protein n=1 Tax=Araneus ventricosus TaxID=182803 RepID=A0A4Y2ASN9_ARAVE|nr:hypothetical protein AVEN_106356-1 [Araneus ventricosus]
MLLFASIPRGMQYLLDISNLYLGARGLRINFLKSFSISLVPSGHDKKIKIAQGSFRVGNTPIPHLCVEEEWTYLGVPFTPTGKAKVLEHLRPKLEILTRAPLKPQQWLFFEVPPPAWCPFICWPWGELPSLPLKRRHRGQELSKKMVRSPGRQPRPLLLC